MTGVQTCALPISGELGVRASHEGRHLLVPDLDEIDRFLRPIQSAEDAVDPVPGIAVDAMNAPGLQAFDEEVGGGF